MAGAAALFATVSGTSPVVVAAAPLSKGQIIGPADPATAAAAADPSVQVVPADQLPGLVGQRAAVDVPAGALLTAWSVTSDLAPRPGPGPHRRPGDLDPDRQRPDRASRLRRRP